MRGDTAKLKKLARDLGDLAKRGTAQGLIRAAGKASVRGRLGTDVERSMWMRASWLVPVLRGTLRERAAARGQPSGAGVRARSARRSWLAARVRTLGGRVGRFLRSLRGRRAPGRDAQGRFIKRSGGPARDAQGRFLRRR